MRQFWCICIFLFGCYSISAQAILADSLFEVGSFNRAALAYERAYFTEKEPALKNHLLLKKYYCYKYLQRFDRAGEVLDRVRVSRRDTLFATITYEMALIHYLQQDYDRSYNLLLKYQLFAPDPSRDFLFLESLNLIAMNKWKEARRLLSQHKDFLDITEAEVDQIFDGKLKPKSSAKAFTLSMFLPGVGQMYSGHFFKGLVSGGVQAGLVGVSAYSLYKGYFFTGGMTGVALFYTFYFGGARYAGRLAEDYNKERSEALSAQLLQVWQ